MISLAQLMESFFVGASLPPRRSWKAGTTPMLWDPLFMFTSMHSPLCSTHPRLSWVDLFFKLGDERKAPLPGHFVQIQNLLSSPRKIWAMIAQTSNFQGASAFWSVTSFS